MCEFKRARRLLHQRILLFVAIMWLISAASAAAHAQSEALFAPLSSGQLASPTPDQTSQVDRLRQTPTTESLQLVRVNLDVLRGNTATIALGEARPVQAVRRNMVVRSDRDFSWTGDLLGVGGQALLVVQDGNVTGTIRSGVDLYRIVPVGGGVHAVIKVDQSKFPSEHPKDDERRGDARRPLTDG
jgi:peptidyl-Asp metalloendopeptidase